jgi:hypothetical protein
MAREDEIAPWDRLKAGSEPGSPGPLAPGPVRDPARWVFGLLLLAVVAIVAVVVYFVRRPAPETRAAAVASSAPAQAAPVRPLAENVPPVALPPLAETDPVVRELVGKLSSHPRVAAWLATGGLVRNFTVVVANVAEGRTPAALMRGQRPAASFHVIERAGATFIDPASYERYTAFADAVRSLDPMGAAQVYGTLKPRIEEAYRELGYETPFDRALEQAIVRLLQTPVPNGPLRVVPAGGTGYAFADSRLEELGDAQKHLLRAGPANARAIQMRLREIALALGIPAERLPAASH